MLGGHIYIKRMQGIGYLSVDHGIAIRLVRLQLEHCGSNRQELDAGVDTGKAFVKVACSSFYDEPSKETFEWMVRMDCSG